MPPPPSALNRVKLCKCNFLQHSAGGGGGSPVARSLHFESLERDPEVGAGFITVQKRPTGPSSALLIPTTLSTKGNSINDTTGFFFFHQQFFCHPPLLKYCHLSPKRFTKTTLKNKGVLTRSESMH